MVLHKASRESDGFIWRSKSPWKSLLVVPYSVIPHLLPQPKDMIWNAWHDLTHRLHTAAASQEDSLYAPNEHSPQALGGLALGALTMRKPPHLQSC